MVGKLNTTKYPPLLMAKLSIKIKQHFNKIIKYNYFFQATIHKRQIVVVFQIEKLFNYTVWTIYDVQILI